jgi:hypothetical protein
VLRLDPSLLTRPDYLTPYPTLATFLSQHPEVAHNPVFFLGSGVGMQYVESRTGVANAVENIFVGLEVAIGVMFGIGTFAWLARSAIDYRRWLRAMKIQTEAHTKIVDRLASNDDLLAYVQSTAGQRGSPQLSVSHRHQHRQGLASSSTRGRIWPWQQSGVRRAG